jgi:hypothetical protein
MNIDTSTSTGMTFTTGQKGSSVPVQKSATVIDGKDRSL